MIITMPATTTTAVAKRLIKLREEGGAVALGRVLTLLVVADADRADEAIDAANVASGEHPCRIIVLSRTAHADPHALDAEIRVGGDAGASEVVVLHAGERAMDHADTLVTPLLLPDAPIVAWWPGEPPADPARDIVGSMAHRRITDAYGAADPHAALARLAGSYSPGDTDLAWTRTTVWRGLIAATLDQPPFEPVRSARVEGVTGHPSLDLIGAWLAHVLRCPVEIVRTDDAPALTRVVLSRRSGDISLSRPTGKVAILSQPNQPDHRVALPIRELHECIAEELRRLDPDEMYGDVLTRGLTKVVSA